MPDSFPRLDLAHRWAEPSPPAVVTPPEVLINSGDVAGWLSSQLECTVGVMPVGAGPWVGGWRVGGGRVAGRWWVGGGSVVVVGGSLVGG